MDDLPTAGLIVTPRHPILSCFSYFMVCGEEVVCVVLLLIGSWCENAVPVCLSLLCSSTNAFVSLLFACVSVSSCSVHLMGNNRPSYGLMFLGEMKVRRLTTTSVEAKCVSRNFVLVLLNSCQSSALSLPLYCCLKLSLLARNSWS